MTTKPTDDLEAVRGLVDLLQAFSNEERERIIRWAREKLGMTVLATSVVTKPGAPSDTANEPESASGKNVDIKSFVSLKAPQSDRQFAAVVAYYYRFEALASDKKESIDKKDLEHACRLAGRHRIRYPIQTLNNALLDGYLDKAERGKYRINAVGENLIAMVLPSNEGSKKTSRKAKPKNRGAKPRKRKPRRS